MQIKFVVAAVAAALFTDGFAASPSLPPMVRPAAVAGAFAEGEALSFDAPSGLGGLTWAVYDWTYRPVDAGVWPANGRLVLKPLPKGYYYLQARTAETNVRECTFCVVPDPRTRQFPEDSFYGVDAALSWVGRSNAAVLNWYGTNSFAAALDLIRLCGLGHVRERMSWGEVSSKPGECKWGRYAENVGHARARGTRLLGMFHDAAPYAGRPRNPVDLKAVYDFCRAYGEMGGGTMSAWEFWNEQDISFWPGPCWNYVAAMKAAYLGYKAANPAAPVLNGAVCRWPRNTFDNLMFSNDLAKFINVFGLHLYSGPKSYPVHFADLDDFLARQGIGDIDRWITESSSNIEGEAALESLMPGVMAQSRAQELLVAELYPKERILMQMGGIGRDYFFVFGPYSERNGTKDWGVQRRDGSVKPVFAAISAMTERLVSAKIVGEMSVGEGIRCFVFAQPDGSQTVAYWTVSPCDASAADPVGDVERTQRNRLPKAFSLAASDGEYRGVGWCGTPFSAKASGGRLALTAERYVSFLDGLGGLAVDRPARPRGKVRAYVPAADEDVTVVIRADFSPDDFDITDNKTVAELKAGHQSGAVKLHVWNLSGRAKTGRLEIAGVQAEGVPGTIGLPAWGETAIEAKIGLSAGSRHFVDMTAVGVFDGRRSTRLVAPIRSLDRFLANSEVVKVGANDVDYWTRNDSAQEFKSSWDAKEQAVRFDLKWTNPKTDRWFYPVHMFKDEDRRQTLDGATMIEFEARLEQDKVENDVSTALMMPLAPSGSGRHMAHVSWSAHPSREWQKIRIALVNRDGTASCTGANGFRLGFNPRGKVVTFWVRNLAFVKPR